MDILRSVRAVAEAEGPGVVDWDRAAAAAKGATEPGSIALSDAERAGYAADVRDARSRLAEVAGIEFDVPDTVEVQNRHHWIDASVGTFRRVMDPIEAAAADPGGPDGTFDATPARRGPAFAQDVSRVANTGSMAFALGFLSRNVLGQYDPLLLADEPDADHGLYFVHPNIVAVARTLDVDYPRFRRWIAFHEVTHAAEFGAAPWLPEYLESRVERGVEGMTDRGLDPDAFAELQAAMTAVEGYAEVLMDRAFDGEAGSSTTGAAVAARCGASRSASSGWVSSGASTSAGPPSSGTSRTSAASRPRARCGSAPRTSRPATSWTTRTRGSPASTPERRRATHSSSYSRALFSSEPSETSAAVRSNRSSRSSVASSRSSFRSNSASSISPVA